VPVGVSIAKLAWDFERNGVYDIVCGPLTPAVSHAWSTPGTKSVAVTVTDSLGRVTTGVQSVQVTGAQVNRASGAESFATCENPGANNQPDRTDCVKTLAFAIVEINSRGGPNDCFKLEARAIPLFRPTKEARGARGAKGGLPSPAIPLRDARWYHATLKGPVAINGIYVPLPATRVTEYDTGTSSVGIGKATVQVGPYRLPGVDLAMTVPPRKPKVRVELGNYGLEGNVKALGGLPVGARVKGALLDRKSEFAFELALPNVFTLLSKTPARISVFVLNDNANGFRIDGASGKVPTAFLGPLEITDLSLEYRKADNTWNGGANLKLAELSPVALRASPEDHPDNGFGLRDGRFDHAGAALDFPIPGAQPQIFPGVFLRRIGFSIGVNPTRFRGTGTIAVGQVAEVDGELAAIFASQGAPYTFPQETGPLNALAGSEVRSTAFALGGKVNLKVPKLDFQIPLQSAYGVYVYPDYFGMGGGFEFGIADVFKLKGGVNGWVVVGTGTFDVEGKVEICLDDLACVEGGAVVSSKGIGACAVVPIPFGLGTVPLPAGVGYKWGELPPDIMIGSCSTSGYREQNPIAGRVLAGAGRRPLATSTITLPAGLPAATVRVRGDGGEPLVALVAPDGRRFEVTAAGGLALTEDVVGLRQSGSGFTLVGLVRPQAGVWTVESLAGSVPLAKVEVANGLPEPKVRASVTGSGARRTLRWTVERVPGQLVQFVEQGARTYRVLGPAASGNGSLAFTPGEGDGGTRRVVALVIRDGVVTSRLPVATFRAPPPARPGAVTRLRLTRRGSAIVARWAAASGARRYAVEVRSGDGRRALRVVRGRSLRLAGYPSTLRVTVTVRAIGANGQRGPAATATRLPEL
jgi:hypothetical protein